MKRFTVLIAIALSACQTNRPETIERGNNSIAGSKPGTVIAQSIRNDLGNGFYDVSKSVINSAGHWEGIGHFGYLYYGKTEVCRCSVYNTSISPDGTYVVYHSHKEKRLVIYWRCQKIILATPNLLSGI